MCPTRRAIGQRVNTSAVTSAPAAGAARNAPKLSGPDMKMSRTKIGSSAVALPSNTANRSSRMAPSTTLCWPMKTRPLNSRLRSTGSRGATRRSMTMPRMTIPAESHSTAQVAKTSVGLSAISKPPSAGPATMAICAADVDPAIARGSTLAGTMFGSAVCRLGCSKARPVPTQNAMARRRCGVSRPVARRERQHRDGERLEELRHRSDQAAVVAVRRMAGGQEQPDARNELHEPDQPELKWTARQFVHLPADGDGLDLKRDGGRDPHIKKADVGAMAQQIDGRAGVACHCGR